MYNAWKRIRFVWNVRRFLPFLKDFYLSTEVPNGRKLLSVIGMIGYFLIPFDLIPDFLMGFGLLDDVTIFLFILQGIVKMAPLHLQEKYQLLP